MATIIRATGAAVVLFVPYVPLIYPDELTGCWLSRVRLYNGSGAWRQLLESVGLGRRIDTYVFDIIDPRPELEFLLEELGMSYEQALLEHTTLPYWLAFDTYSLSERIPVTENVPTIGIKAPVTRPSKLGLARLNGEAVIARFCSSCMLADIREYGEPYWHRSHQLPNVFTCPVHNCVLLSACPQCGWQSATALKNLPRLPCPRCQCGYVYGNERQGELLPESYHRLVRISCDALANGTPTRDKHSVRSYLRARLAQHSESLYANYTSILADQFGATRNSIGMNLSAKLTLENSTEVTLRFQGYFSQAKAPECCALLAGLNIDFRAAMEAMHESEKDPDSHRERTMLQVPSLKFARSILANSSRHTPSSRLAYWVVRLRDPLWLMKRGGIISAPVPSIVSDRRVLRSIITDKKMLRAQRKQKLYNCVSAIRARIRDAEWYISNMAALKSKAGEALKRANQERLKKRIVAIEAAIKKTISAKLRPRRLNAAVLAPAVGLSQWQVAEAIRSSPRLQRLLNNTNSSKYRRQVVIAAQTLVEQGLPLTKNRLSRASGLPTSREITAIMDEVIQEFGQIPFQIGERPRKWSEEESREIVELRAQSLSFAEIGDKLGITEDAAAWRYYAVTGAAKTGRRLTCGPDDVRRLKQKGLSLAAIAKQLRISPTSAFRLYHAGTKAEQAGMQEMRKRTSSRALEKVRRGQNGSEYNFAY